MEKNSSSYVQQASASAVRTSNNSKLALRQLLQILELPKTSNNQQKIVDILKCYPELMAKFIIQRQLTKVVQAQANSNQPLQTEGDPSQPQQASPGVKKTASSNEYKTLVQLLKSAKTSEQQQKILDKTKSNLQLKQRQVDQQMPIPLACSESGHLPQFREQFIQQQSQSELEKITDAEIEGPVMLVDDNERAVAARTQHPAQPVHQSRDASTSEINKTKLKRQQLLILLHAQDCPLEENQSTGEGLQCTLPHCRTVKNVLIHMTTCQAGKSCSVAYCHSSRQIISHWNSCTRSECGVCLPVKQAYTIHFQEYSPPVILLGNEGGTTSQIRIFNPLPAEPFHQSWDESIVDSEKTKLIQRQLIYLLHTYYCQRRKNSSNSEFWQCALPYCQTVQNLFCHMKTCQAGKFCLVPHCSSSWIILSHWSSCKWSGCSLCFALKQACTILNNKNVWRLQTSNVAVGSDQPEMVVPNVFPQLGADPMTAGQQNIGSAGSIPQCMPNTLFGDLNHVTSAMPSAANFPASLQPPGGSQSSQVTTTRKDWHPSVNPDMRMLLVKKIVDAVFPCTDPQTMANKRMHNLVAYARKLEGDLYEMANSRAEYYYLAFEKIKEMQMEIEKKKYEFASQQ